MEMPATLKTNIKRILIDHEGKRKFPYLDTKGNTTIGIGYNLTSRGLPETWIQTQFNDDIDFLYDKLNTTFDWFKKLSEPRQAALIDLAYNVGWKNFLLFKQMLYYIQINDFANAGNEILDSTWTADVGKQRTEDNYNLLVNNTFT